MGEVPSLKGGSDERSLISATIGQPYVGATGVLARAAPLCFSMSNKNELSFRHSGILDEVEMIICKKGLHGRCHHGDSDAPVPLKDERVIRNRRR